MGHVPKEPTSVAKGTYRGRHRRQPHQLAPHFLQPAEIKEKEVIVTAWMDSVVVQKKTILFLNFVHVPVFWGHMSTFVCACGKSFASVSSLRKHWSWNGSGCMTGWFAFSLFLSLFMVLNDWCQCVVSDWWMDSHASWHCNKYCETLWLNSLFRWKQALNFAPVSPGVCIYITQPPCSSQQMGWTSLLCGRRGGGGKV